MRSWRRFCVLILLQGKTTVETLVKKEREPRLHLSWTHIENTLPMQQQAAFLNRPSGFALDLCHMRIYISPLIAPGQCHPFQFFIGSCPVV